MIVNVQAPVLETVDGVVHLNRPKLRLFRSRSQRRPVWFTRTLTIDRDTPVGMVARVTRHAVMLMHADLSSRQVRPVAVRVRLQYA